jgi:hypothetical protein
MKKKVSALVSCIISATVISAVVVTYEPASAGGRMQFSAELPGNSDNYSTDTKQAEAAKEREKAALTVQIESMDKYFETKGPDWGSVERAPLGSAPDISQQFSAQNLPDSIVINQYATDRDSATIQPRLDYLEITGLQIAGDGKTVNFNLKNTFTRPHAKPLRIGGLMLTAMVRYDYDNGAALHNAVLFKENRLELKKGIKSFSTDPASYPSVLKIESLRFFLTPPIASLMESAAKSTASLVIPENAKDISQEFVVGNLPEMIVFDRNTIEQHAAARDPRLSYLRIVDLKVGADGKTVTFNVQNNFGRRLQEPIHIGELILTAKARYDYDNGVEQHGSILLSVKHAVLQQGDNYFQTDATMYPHVTKLDSLQFFFGLR